LILRQLAAPQIGPAEHTNEPWSSILAPSPAHIRSTIAAVVDQPEDLRALRLVHKALADVNRLRIVQRLAQGEASVSELIERVGLSQPLVSWHLGRLRVAGLIQTRRVGRETVSRLLPEAFGAFTEYERRVLGLEHREQAAS
jgi:DNA-binding transcriptional ArsR family regulator